MSSKEDLDDLLAAYVGKEGDGSPDQGRGSADEKDAPAEDARSTHATEASGSSPGTSATDLADELESLLERSLAAQDRSPAPDDSLADVGRDSEFSLDEFNRPITSRRSDTQDHAGSGENDDDEDFEVEVSVSDFSQQETADIDLALDGDELVGDDSATDTIPGIAPGNSPAITTKKPGGSS